MNRFWIVAAAIALLPMPSFGQVGWGRIVRGWAFEEFRDGDWEMFRQSVRRAANDPVDGNPVAWANAKTGAQGTVSVIKRFDSPKLGECRVLRGNASAKGRAGPFTITLCRQAGGAWQIAQNGDASSGG